jgi:hypothetical protein
MFALGLGRFKTFRQKRFKLRETVNEPFFEFGYCSHRGHQRLSAHDVHHAGEIIGEYVQRHLGGHPAAAPAMSVMPRKRRSATINTIGRDGPETDSCAAANSISIRFYSITSSARAMSFTNGSTLICINDVARKHKRDVLATPQHVEIKRRVKCLKCEYAFWQQSLRLALDLAEPCLPRQCR